MNLLGALRNLPPIWHYWHSSNKGFVIGPMVGLDHFCLTGLERTAIKITMVRYLN